MTKSRYLTERSLEWIGKWVGEVLRPIKVRLDALEARPQLQYLGPWKAKCMYAEGSAVTSDGSIFIAMQSTDTKPGSDSTWQLARGRDAR